MKSCEVATFTELHEALSTYSTNTTAFRGHCRVSYKLWPFAGRMTFIVTKNTREGEERLIFKKFKQRAVPLLEFQPEKDWDWLALAQHHGLPTRLLDWSLNPCNRHATALELRKSVRLVTVPPRDHDEKSP